MLSPPPHKNELRIPERRPLVLVIDDDDGFRALLKAELQLSGYEVMQASDGITGLALVDQRPPDAIILDLDLPRINGLAVRDELLSRDSTRDIPVVIVTGTEWTPHSQARVLLLRKPFSTPRILRALWKVLETRR